jgi:hypothetical protein
MRPASGVIRTGAASASGRGRALRGDLAIAPEIPSIFILPNSKTVIDYVT